MDGGTLVRMYKNTIWIIALLLSMMLISSACSVKSNENDNGSPKEPITFTVLMNSGGSTFPHEVSQSENPYLRELRKRSGYNVKFEIIDARSSAFRDTMTVRFATGDLADLVYVRNINWPIPGAVENGQLLELGPLIDQYAPNIKAKMPDEVWKSPDIYADGKIYATPRLPSMGAATDGRILFIREDWLEQLNLDMPETIEEWLAYFEAVKHNDMNGNGKNDEYGALLYDGPYYSSQFFGQYGIIPGAWHFIDGKMIPDIIRPEMKEAIRFYRLLTESGYVPPDWLTIPRADRDDTIYRGEAGSWMNDLPALTSTWAEDKFLDPNARINIVGGPLGTESKRGLQAASKGTGPVWVIPKSSKKAVDVVKFLNWAWSDDAQQLFSLGVEGHNYTRDNHGNIVFDPKSPANSENDGLKWNRAILGGLHGDMRMTPEVIHTTDKAEMLINGIDIVKKNVVPHDGQFMPILETGINKPELQPSFEKGTLFYEMFAKVVFGQEELDSAFDRFVKEWKNRGGNEMIEEATSWYLKQNN